MINFMHLCFLYKRDHNLTIGTLLGVLIFMKVFSKKKPASFETGFIYKRVIIVFIYFTLSTIALNASGWFIAKSAKTLRFNPISLAFTLPINCE